MLQGKVHKWILPSPFRPEDRCFVQTNIRLDESASPTKSIPKTHRAKHRAKQFFHMEPKKSTGVASRGSSFLES